MQGEKKEGMRVTGRAPQSWAKPAQAGEIKGVRPAVRLGHDGEVIAKGVGPQRVGRRVGPKIELLPNCCPGPEGLSCHLEVTYRGVYSVNDTFPP